MYSPKNKQLVSSHNCFAFYLGFTRKRFKTFSHNKCLRGQHAARELRVQRAWSRLMLELCLKLLAATPLYIFQNSTFTVIPSFDGI
jgi:hypothetical protein